MNPQVLNLIMIQLPVLLFSVMIHECAHGWMAERCGDDTARVMGRITLNPIPHIDIIGTIILPLVFILSSSPFMFAYAKPVPINPYRFNNPRRDTMLVSFSGPASNLILAICFSLILRFLMIMPFSVQLKAVFMQLFVFAVLINIFLALLNLIPIPPLDGSGIVSGLLPPDLAYKYEKIRPYGFVIIIVLLSLGIISSITMPILRFFSIILLGGIV